MAEPSGLIPVGQAARLLMISEERIRQLVKQGYVLLHIARWAKVVRIPASSIPSYAIRSPSDAQAGSP